MNEDIERTFMRLAKNPPPYKHCVMFDIHMDKLNVQRQII